MRRGPRAAGRAVMPAAALTALLLACASPTALAAVPAEERHWIEFKSPHYTVISSATPRRTVDVVKRLERYDQTLGTVSTGSHSSPRPRACSTCSTTMPR